MTEPTPPIDSSARPTSTTNQPTSEPRPRIAIQYCTQCKWMLRAAYFAQELLSTFNTSLREVSLIPKTGGVFRITLSYPPTRQVEGEEEEDGKVLWDRKVDGGFPEVKILKSRVRDVIDPGRSLGHTDRALKQTDQPSGTDTTQVQVQVQSPRATEAECTDCQ